MLLKLCFLFQLLLLSGLRLAIFFNKAFGGFTGFNGIYLKLVYIIDIVATKIDIKAEIGKYEAD